MSFSNFDRPLFHDEVDVDDINLKIKIKTLKKFRTDIRVKENQKKYDRRTIKRINKLYSELREETREMQKSGQLFKTVKPRKYLKEWSQYTNTKNRKVFFIPVTDKNEKVRIRKNKRGVSVKRENEFFNMREIKMTKEERFLLTSAEDKNGINEVLKNIIKKEKEKVFYALAFDGGTYAINTIKTNIEQLTNQVYKMMTDYGGTDPRNHIVGVMEITPRNQKTKLDIRAVNLLKTLHNKNKNKNYK